MPDKSIAILIVEDEQIVAVAIEGHLQRLDLFLGILLSSDQVGQLRIAGRRPCPAGS